MNFDGRNEVRVQMTVDKKIVDQKYIKANLQNQDGKYPHNINVTDQALMAVLEIGKTYDVTIQRGNGKLDENNKPINPHLSYGYFWNLIELHQEQAPVEEGHMVRAAVAMGARVINETENKQAPKPFSEWREEAEERKQKSIERQQLIVFANQILTDHDKLQIELAKLVGYTPDLIAAIVEDRVNIIISIAKTLEPYFATGFQQQVLTEEVGGILKEELFPPVNEPPRRSDAELRALLDQPSQYDDLNNPELR